ncbi:hypothetical protein HOP50_04g30270 [Chloropicon primus]|uniref:WD40 repeat domain-containing protein n=1 Tax=Chloropicon primus TaxID=1764295 RepID=A0A5B8MJC2_9CHLO|nr:hypothetical protein A3770_04p30270 [Chloropicon primus]UPQ99719.1 hypothetical protein HOP50_04g30270 [Chloropicon primus]|mmetsp:Transcript_3573/g.10088  ORF Transcript_3573/g.10088 Transcript_3573/m.10088 type:complete len:759 (+) Transcript_3573:620-2896(+)|eukprot:QDZ20509.1 hypothetical protein A3770_04p30270 [Chloropicon primus]
MSSTSKVAVPPSPNWYSSQISDVSRDGELYAYASHSYVVVVRPGTGEVLHQLAGHKGRVTSLTFLRGRGKYARHFLVTGSRDKTLIVWDAYSGKPIRAMSGHRSEIGALESFHEGEGASESRFFVGDFVSVDSSGWAFHWDVCSPEKPLHKIQLPQTFSGALCTFDCGTVSSSEHLLRGREGRDLHLIRNLLCYGTVSGEVCLVDVESQDVVQTWRPHSGSVCQVRSQVEGPNLLIMSTCKSGEIKVYAGRSEGGVLLDDVSAAIVLTPDQRLTANERARNWASSVYISGGENDKSARSILVTDLKGQIWKWNMAEGVSKGVGAAPFIAHHNRPIFRMDAMPGGGLLSCSMDRQVACFSANGSAQWAVRGFGGHAQCVCASGSQGKLAVACGDSTIRVYGDSLTAEAEQSRGLKEVQFLWNGLQNVSFSWMSFHPKQDDLLVFSTEGGDGIGVYNLFLGRVTYMSTRMGIQHAELRKEQTASFGEILLSPPTLYTLQSGKLLAWHKDVRQWGEMHTSKVRQEVDFSVCTRRTEGGGGSDTEVRAFSFSSSGKYLVLATESNDIHIFHDQEELQSANGGERNEQKASLFKPLSAKWYHLVSVSREGLSIDSDISCVSAGHETKTDDGGERLDIFAGYQDGSVLYERVVTSAGNHQCKKILIVLPQAHKARVRSIVFNSHLGDHWASVAQGEPSIKVWCGPNEESGSEGAGATLGSITLEGHHASVLSLCWSSVSPRCLYSASEDQSLRLWECWSGVGEH